MNICKYYDTLSTQVLLLLIAILAINMSMFFSLNEQLAIAVLCCVSIVFCIFLNGKKTSCKNIERLVMAYSISNGFFDFILHLGYQGFVLPKWFRKSFSKSKIHKNWFQGFYGYGILSILERTNEECSLVY